MGALRRHRFLDFPVPIVLGTGYPVVHLARAGPTSRLIVMIIVDVLGTYGKQSRGGQILIYLLGATCRVKPATGLSGIQRRMMYTPPSALPRR